MVSLTTITADADHVTADSQCITADGASVCAPDSTPESGTSRVQPIVVNAETKNIIAKIMRGYSIIAEVDKPGKDIVIEVGIERENIVIGVDNV